MKKYLIIGAMAVLGLFLATSATANDYQTHKLLEKGNYMYGNGVDAFTLNAISGIVVTTDAITAQVADATDLWTIDSDAAATPSAITATFTAATSGTFDFNATTDVLSIACNGSGTKTTDGTGVTMSAFVIAANALTYSLGSPACDVELTLTNNMGYARPEDMAAEDNAAAAGTLVFTTATDAGTGGDAYVDCTGLTLDGCVAALNTLDNIGGITADYTFTVEGTQNGDLANSANDIADEGPTDLTSTVQFPFTSDDAPASYVENDDWNQVCFINALIDATGNTGVTRIYDGSTLIFESTAMTDATMTNISAEFDNPGRCWKAQNADTLTVQLYHPGAMIVNTLMYVGGNIQ